MAGGWRRRAGRCDEQGASAVEFALISPVFFMALFGIAQFGWAFLCGHSVRSAVQKEARLLPLGRQLLPVPEDERKQFLAGCPGPAHWRP